jgi:hypothetical protein
MKENPFKNMVEKAKNITKTVGLAATLAASPLNDAVAQKENIQIDDPTKKISLNISEKKNSHEPIFVTDPNDPRLKEYEDSLALYENSPRYLEEDSGTPIPYLNLELKDSIIHTLEQHAEKYNLAFIYSKEPSDIHFTQKPFFSSPSFPFDGVIELKNFLNTEKRLVYVSKKISSNKIKPIGYQRMFGQAFPGKGLIYFYYPIYQKSTKEVVYKKVKHGDMWEVAMNGSGTYGLYDKQGTLRKGGFKTSQEAKDFYNKYYDENGAYRADIYDDTGEAKMAQK